MDRHGAVEAARQLIEPSFFNVKSNSYSHAPTFWLEMYLIDLHLPLLFTSEGIDGRPGFRLGHDRYKMAHT